MKFGDLVSTVKTLGNEREVWLTNETFNELGKEKIRLSRKGNLIICSNNVEMEISLEGELVSNCATSFARIERVSEMYPATLLVKESVYFSPKDSQKLSIIL